MNVEYARTACHTTCKTQYQVLFVGRDLVNTIHIICVGEIDELLTFVLVRIS